VGKFRGAGQNSVIYSTIGTYRVPYQLGTYLHCIGRKFNYRYLGTYLLFYSDSVRDAVQVGEDYLEQLKKKQVGNFLLLVLVPTYWFLNMGRYH